MIIEIHPEKKLKEISQAFSQIYPFLKLEFFRKQHRWQESSPDSELLDQELLVSQATENKLASGHIEIHYWQKTGVVEMKFRQQFQLAVQVYRNHQGRWIQTSGTDELTLEDQNEAGMMSFHEYHDFTNAPDTEKKP